MPKLTKTFIDKIEFTDTDKEITFWDNELKGFGIRIRNNSKTWLIMYRNAEGRQKKLTLGKTDKLTPDEARKLAKDKLAEVVKGQDPASDKIETRKQMNVSELCELYLTEGCYNKKESTIKGDIGRIERHIKPLIGKLSLTSLNIVILEKFMLNVVNGKTAVNKKSENKRGTIRVTGGKEAATRTIGLLGSILEFAIRRNIIKENPAHKVKKPKTQKKETFLETEDIKQLGKALNYAESLFLNEYGINAIKLLLLTGCRKNEVLSLKWEYVDFKNKCFRFPDTKTGKQTRPFGQGALNLLYKIKETSKSEWVFPSERNDSYFIGLPKVFSKITSLINPETKEPFINKEVTIHTLRHTFASIGAYLGFTELTIAGLLGHKLGGITNRYSHTVDSSLISAGDKISLHIERALKGINCNENNIIELKRV